MIFRGAGCWSCRDAGCNPRGQEAEPDARRVRGALAAGAPPRRDPRLRPPSRAVSGHDWSPLDRSVDAGRRLRAKLDDLARADSRIATIRGEGYRLAVDVEPGGAELVCRGGALPQSRSPSSAWCARPGLPEFAGALGDPSTLRPVMDPASALPPASPRTPPAAPRPRCRAAPRSLWASRAHGMVACAGGGEQRVDPAVGPACRRRGRCRRRCPSPSAPVPRAGSRCRSSPPPDDARARRWLWLR